MKSYETRYSQARKRLQLRLQREPKLKKRFDKLSEQLLQLSRGKILTPYCLIAQTLIAHFWSRIASHDVKLRNMRASAIEHRKMECLQNY